MSGTLITIAVGIGIYLFTLMCMELPFARNSYRRMSKEKLIKAKVMAMMEERRLLIPQFVMPTLIIFLTLWVEGQFQLYLINTAILLLFLISSARLFFREIRIITTTELEIRKNSEKN